MKTKIYILILCVANFICIGQEFQLGGISAYDFMRNGQPGNGSGITNLQHAVIQTNFISGKSYVNSYGAAIDVRGLVSLAVTAASGGAANITLRCDASPTQGGWTNIYALSTTSLTIAMNYTNSLSLIVPTNANFTFTNLSTVGNSATVIGGQITY